MTREDCIDRRKQVMLLVIRLTVFIARQHACACRARYCFTSSLCLSDCLCQTNGDIVTLFDIFLAPPPLQNSKRYSPQRGR